MELVRTEAHLPEIHERQRSQVEAALLRIVESPEFRGSRRSIDFLSYAVGKWLDRDLPSLKETTIATEVFHKSSKYDPAEDSFVRVKANDMRKRLGAYYEGSGRADPVRIEIPLGSYQPQIVCRDALLPTSPRRRRPFYWLFGGVVILAASGLLALRSSAKAQEPALDRFWTPLVTADRAVMISLPTLPRYLVSSEIGARVREPRHDPNLLVPLADIWVKDDVVGMGASIGTAQIAAHLARMGHLYTIKSGRDLRFADIRSGPAVLLGGFSSAWTLEEMREWRFRIVQPGSIVDTQNSQTVWNVEGLRRDGRADKDYALITRVAKSSGGKALVALCGITTFGTQAAAEFVTSEDRLKELFGHAPSHWNGSNFQAVISMRVKDDFPGSPKLEAAWFW